MKIRCGLFFFDMLRNPIRLDTPASLAQEKSAAGRRRMSIRASRSFALLAPVMGHD